ncbi:uncharacterized protein E0L32_007168 [Thyridium curvatum]|uniref:Uncharacterized protein n=1 Tax=Thyridium curvatum TaxID=1093900 RepID=A0A507AWF0_9PEZI|nr:uncharacterized protein E0L32_007168 [Thyridium curvatum]TPX12053.1 hypothetical protein E0L32_007168 [Thyridium curvatum]
MPFHQISYSYLHPTIWKRGNRSTFAEATVATSLALAREGQAQDQGVDIVALQYLLDNIKYASPQQDSSWREVPQPPAPPLVASINLILSLLLLFRATPHPSKFILPSIIGRPPASGFPPPPSSQHELGIACIMNHAQTGSTASSTQCQFGGPKVGGQAVQNGEYIERFPP